MPKKCFEIITRAYEEFVNAIRQNAPENDDRSRALEAALETRMWALSAIGIDNDEIDHTRKENK